ncbi:unnamed protein product [Blepharisma stoltei]|uniref:Uncharacterized protein n=1 Tax=Blepharisma stoltei TaxID=1481888 RepID=A0AAU9KH55_9CILI|nr:unnamed protein product [Blepharisma stoltei]
MPANWLSIKPLFGISLGVGLGIVGLSFLLREKPKHTHETSVSKTLLLSILKELNREMTALAISLATTAAQIREVLSSNYSEKIITEMIEKSTSFSKQVESIEKRVYERFNTNKKVVEKAYKKDFYNDSDVQDICMKTKIMIDDAFKGIIPIIGNPLPDFVTSEFVLSIMREIYNKTTKTTLTLIKEAKVKGFSVNFSNKSFVEVTQEIEIRTELDKREIFEKYRLFNYEDSPSCIIHNAIKKYSRKSKEFRRELSKIENAYHSVIQQIMHDQVSRDEEMRILNR